MFEILQRLYKEGKLTLQGLENAVAKKWITEEQKEEIAKIVNEYSDYNAT